MKVSKKPPLKNLQKYLQAIQSLQTTYSIRSTPNLHKFHQTPHTNPEATPKDASKPKDVCLHKIFFHVLSVKCKYTIAPLIFQRVQVPIRQFRNTHNRMDNTGISTLTTRENRSSPCKIYKKFSHISRPPQILYMRIQLEMTITAWKLCHINCTFDWRRHLYKFEPRKFLMGKLTFTEEKKNHFSGRNFEKKSSLKKLLLKKLSLKKVSLVTELLLEISQK